MRNRSNKQHIITEWKPGVLDNVGVIIPFPVEILLKHLSKRNIPFVIESTLYSEISAVNLLDLCTVMLFWWTLNTNSGARYRFIINKNHHSSEYVFDYMEKRTVFQIRDPDINGKHWKSGTKHFHRINGETSTVNEYEVCKPIKSHIELIKPSVIYVMCVK